MTDINESEISPPGVEVHWIKVRLEIDANLHEVMSVWQQKEQWLLGSYGTL